MTVELSRASVPLVDHDGEGGGDWPTLVDVFAATAVRAPGRPALVTDDAVLTYAQLSDAATALARRLTARGIGPGARVGVCVASGTADLYVAILGVLFCGAAYVPVDADDPPARAETVWERAAVCAVVGTDLRIDERAGPRGTTRQVQGSDDAWIIFTSGSTGEPKGVAITHVSATAFVRAETMLWTVDAKDRVLAGLSVGFDASCEEMWLAWRHGAALVPAPRALVRAGSELGAWLAARQITVISTVPTLAAMWDQDALAGVRLLILGGEACPDALAWRLAKDREVWNTYGPTEATVVTTATRLEPGRPVTIGWPLHGWQTAVVDDAGASVPPGAPGELVIGGVGLGRYLDEDLDAARFAPVAALGPVRAYRTGDVVCETAAGLAFVGRQDDQIKLGGRRIELGEVDAALAATPGVRAAASAVRTTAAGNTLLVGYVVSDVDVGEIRALVAERLPAGILPTIVRVDELPTRASGKVDRAALPWPPPGAGSAPDDAVAAGGTLGWLAGCWTDQLGPVTITADSDFFALGGSSLAAAKLVSVLRREFPAVTVADLYRHPRLGALADRLDGLAALADREAGRDAPHARRWGVVQLAGLMVMLTLAVPGWLVAILTFDRLSGVAAGPQVGWGWLVAGWLVFASTPGRACIVLVARWTLLGRLKPGRYPRHSWLTCRLWFMERLAEVARIETLAGTPLAPRYARISGVKLGAGVRLGTLPAPTSLVQIGDGATIEGDVDIHGWWMDGAELVVGELRIGAGARIGMRSMLMPGAQIGAGAEIEPGSVVEGIVPAGERWAGTPARRVGHAGEAWPALAPPTRRHRRLWQTLFGAGFVVLSFVPLASVVPGLFLLLRVLPGHVSFASSGLGMLALAPVVAAGFLVTYALLVAVLVRLVSPWVRAGLHPDEGATAFALWFTETLMAGARVVLFPLYSTVFTRSWLRLLGLRVGRRTEISTAVGLNRLVSFGDASFAADDVIFAGVRARDGWLHVSPITVGDGTFLGNGALVAGDTVVGDACLVGVLTVAPSTTADGTSWFGSPALELPRVPDCGDRSRTTDPPRHLVLARAAMELLRILLPTTISIILVFAIYITLDVVGQAAGLAAMLLVGPFVLLAAGLVAVAFTVAAKWLLMGRYTSGTHPLWSFFVWRDELINSFQEQLAGAWLLDSALATPLMSAYLRAMGSRIGRNVWCETLTITEFDLVDLGPGCAINRRSCVETHLFHDRLMRIGPTALGTTCTLGPSAAALPDTRLGDHCNVGWRAVVMRGEELPSNSRWHGSPVSAV